MGYVQTTFSINHSASLAGMKADSEDAKIDTFIAEGSAVGFGLVVSQGTDDDQATLGGSAPVGITVRSLAREGAASTAVVSYADTEAMSVMTRGKIYVTIGGDGGAPGAAVHYNTTTGALVVNTSGNPGSGELTLNEAVLRSTTASGSIGVVELNGQPFSTTAP